MTIPDYQSVMKPFLNFLNDRKEHSLGETVEYISDFFNLSSEERRELLPSGNQEIIRNRVGWDRTYLGKSGLLGPPYRALCKPPVLPVVMTCNVFYQKNKFLDSNNYKDSLLLYTYFHFCMYFFHFLRTKKNSEIYNI
jgi:restriction endonuclease Mrr